MCLYVPRWRTHRYLVPTYTPNPAVGQLLDQKRKNLCQKKDKKETSIIWTAEIPEFITPGMIATSQVFVNGRGVAQVPFRDRAIRERQLSSQPRVLPFGLCWWWPLVCCCRNTSSFSLLLSRSLSLVRLAVFSVAIPTRKSHFQDSENRCYNPRPVRKKFFSSFRFRNLFLFCLISCFASSVGPLRAIGVRIAVSLYLS